MSAPEPGRGWLFRRRQMWVPTLAGWALMLALAAGAIAVFLFNANRFLSPNEPVAGARTLIVEGWLEREQLLQAVAAYRRGHYERVLTTGGPIESWDEGREWKNFSERAAQFLRSNGVADVPVIAVPTPLSKQERTFLSAVMVREWAQQSGIELGAVDVFSADVHARRSRMTFAMAFGPDVKVGILAATATQYDDQKWWTTSGGAKATMGELLSLAWTKCFFWPGPPGSHEERWAVPAPARGASAVASP